MTIDSLTPQMSRLLERIRRAGRAPFHTMTPLEARAAYEAGAEVLDLPRAPLPRVEDIVIPADDGVPLPARLYAPMIRTAHASPLPAMLYLHGGGFTIGSIETHDSLCRQFAMRSGIAVVSLGYRLAPEHRFPVAVDDAWAALKWLHREAETLGLDSSRLAVGGDSAGGTLAAVCALYARDANLPLSLQVLITPGTTAYADTASHRRFASGTLLDAPTIAWFFDQYIDHEQRIDWRFAPLAAVDHEGVAPACIMLAECDPLVDEGVAYGDVLRAAGVAVQLELTRGVTHDFIKMGRSLPEAGAAQESIANALKEAFR